MEDFLINIILDARESGGYYVGHDQAQYDLEGLNQDPELFLKWSKAIFHDLPSMAMEMDMDDEMEIIWDVQDGYFNGLLAYVVSPDTPFSKEIIDVIVDYLKDDHRWHKSVEFVMEKLVDKGSGRSLIDFTKKALALWNHVSFIVPEPMTKVYHEVIASIQEDYLKMDREAIFKKYEWLSTQGVNVHLEAVDEQYGSFVEMIDYWPGTLQSLKLIFDMGLISESSFHYVLGEIIYSEAGIYLNHDEIEVVDSTEHSFMVRLNEDFYLVRVFPEVVVDII